MATLLQKACMWYLGRQQEYVSDDVKQALEYSPKFAHFHDSSGIPVHTDTSGIELAPVLLQANLRRSEQVLEYTSCRFTNVQSIHHSTGLKSLAFLLMLQTFQHNRRAPIHGCCRYLRSQLPEAQRQPYHKVSSRCPRVTGVHVRNQKPGGNSHVKRRFLHAPSYAGVHIFCYVERTGRAVRPWHHTPV